MFMDEFKKIRNKNLLQFKIAKERLNSNDEEFKLKLKRISSDIEKNSNSIVDVLQDFFDHPNITVVLDKEFDSTKVKTILKDKEFIAFLIISNLYNRIQKPVFKDNGSLIVRLYFAILEYEDYIKDNDVKAIIRGEKKYKTLIEANTNLKLHATEVSDVLYDFVKNDEKYIGIDYEIIFEIINDVSFAAMSLENNLYDKIINLKNSSDDKDKTRIISAIENFILYWLEKI